MPKRKPVTEEGTSSLKEPPWAESSRKPSTTVLEEKDGEAVRKDFAGPREALATRALQSTEQPNQMRKEGKVSSRR